MNKSEWHGKTVLITGASYGIGESFAQQLAAAGANLILTARSRERLEALASDLRQRHPVKVSVITADLSSPAGPQQLISEVARLDQSVDLLVNNAGFGQVGDFVDSTLSRQMEMIQLNVNALVELTHAFLRPMVERNSGAILNVASTASFQAVPYFAVYAATKAFVLIFSEAVQVECAPFNVRVLALCPGRTATHFQEVAGSEGREGPTQTPDEVVQVGLDALARGKSHVVSGTSNRVVVQVERFLPRGLVTRAAGRLYQQFSTRGKSSSPSDSGS